MCLAKYRIVVRTAVGLTVAAALHSWTPAGPLAAQAPAADIDNRRIVAVLYFDNHTGDAEFDALGRGIAEMLITDLSGLARIRLVERSRLNDLIQEQEFSRSDHSDPATALRMGRMLAAEYIVAGSFVKVDPQLRVDGRVIGTESGEIHAAAEAQGEMDGFFAIHDELTAAILDGLEITLTAQEEEEFSRWRESNRIEDAETLRAYGQALNYFDRGMHFEALERMAYVSRRAPGSQMVDMTYQHMRAAAGEQARQEGRSFLRRLWDAIFGGE